MAFEIFNPTSESLCTEYFIGAITIAPYADCATPFNLIERGFKMSWEEVGKQVTVIGAVIAAITGSWNLWLQMRGKHDRFVVRMGGLWPSIEQETLMHVVSLSDHPIKLNDWGFIESNGRFQSARMAWETDQLRSEETTHRGSSDLEKRNDHYEWGYICQNPPLGAFAISVTQQYPRICFNSNTPYWRRLWINLQLLWADSYLLV